MRVCILANCYLAKFIDSKSFYLVDLHIENILKCEKNNTQINAQRVYFQNTEERALKKFCRLDEHHTNRWRW